MYWKVVSTGMNAEFPTAVQAIQFAKSKSNEDPLCEVIVEECGTEACFCLMKFSGKRNEFLDVID